MAIRQNLQYEDRLVENGLALVQWFHGDGKLIADTMLENSGREVSSDWHMAKDDLYAHFSGENPDWDSGNRVQKARVVAKQFKEYPRLSMAMDILDSYAYRSQVEQNGKYYLNYGQDGDLCLWWMNGIPNLDNSDWQVVLKEAGHRLLQDLEPDEPLFAEVKQACYRLLRTRALSKGFSDDDNPFLGRLLK